jgi:hypothetical protein
MEHLAGFQAIPGRAVRVGGVALQGLLLVVTCVYLGRLASDGSFGIELVGLILVGIFALALVVPPHFFVAVALLVFGAYSLSADDPLAFGGALVYSTDFLLALVLVRALLPRQRLPHVPLGSAVVALFAIWAAVMVVAGLRGVFGGHDLVSLIRLETPLIYSVGFYFGFGRIVREREFELDKAVRNLLIVSLGFVTYMAFARLTNSPFETDETVGQLGTVVTTGGELRRDYGFASAFILYPLLALGGAAYLLYNPRRTAVAATVAGIGIVTTLLTLIRGEIFGLFLGVAVIAVLRNRSALARAARMRALVASAIVIAIAGLGLWTVDAPTARGIVERSLPGLVQQSEAAESTAQYRQEALAEGFAAAGREPLGVGLIPADALLSASGVELGYLAHSGITTILVYAGWIGLATTVLALAGLLWASFRVPQRVPWLHPFFVGSLVVLMVYSVAADGLLGQGWVVGVAALITALRFQTGSRRESVQQSDAVVGIRSAD